MRKVRGARALLTALGTMALALLVGVLPAAAASVHLKGPLTFTDNGLTLSVSGALAGLGNGDIVVGMTATGNPTATCTNGGTNQPPGQNPAAVTETGATQIPASAEKNGNVPFGVSTNAPTNPIPGAPGCPNSKNWTETITDVAFTSATITVQQPATLTSPGPTVLTVNCTFSPATTNGTVPSSTVTCTSS